MMPGTYKIWFSRTPHHPLGGEKNMERLQKHKTTFPNSQLSVIVNLEGLSSKNKSFVENFCDANQIQLINLRDVVSEIPAKDSLQQALARFAQAEIVDVQYGCLAAASDIVRVLSPALRLELYADFDVDVSSVKPGQLKDNVFIVHTTPQQTELRCNNNIFYIPDNARGQRFAEAWRQQIYDLYMRSPAEQLSEVLKYMPNEDKLIVQHVSKDLTDFINRHSNDASDEIPAIRFRKLLVAFLDSVPDLNADERSRIYDVIFQHHITNLSGPGALVDVCWELGVTYVSKDDPTQEWGSKDMSILNSRFLNLRGRNRIDVVPHLDGTSIGNIRTVTRFNDSNDSSWLSAERQETLSKRRAATVGNQFQGLLELLHNAQLSSIELRPRLNELTALTWKRNTQNQCYFVVGDEIRLRSAKQTLSDMGVKTTIAGVKSSKDYCLQVPMSEATKFKNAHQTTLGISSQSDQTKERKNLRKC